MHQRRGRGGGGQNNSDSDGDENNVQQLLVPPQQQQGQRQEGADALIAVFAKKALSSRKVQIAGVFWVLGLLFMTIMPPLVKVTPEMRSTYEKMAVANPNEMFELNDAQTELIQAENVLYDSKVWFWSWSADTKAAVEKNQAVVSVKRERVEAMMKKRDEQQRAANAVVGIWSEYGMQEVKEKFWSSFEAGKVFAKRQSLFDVFHIMLTSKDEYFLSILFRWVFMALMNFTLGLIGSLFYYSWTLTKMLFSYQTDPLSGLAFFVVGFLGGASIVATYLMGLYGLAVGGVYVVGKFALRDAAIQYAQERRRLREREGRQR